MNEQRTWIAAPSGPEEFHDCIGIVDETYVRVHWPKVYAMERRLYSTYKKYHAVFFLAIVDRKGEHAACRGREGGAACVPCSSCLSACCPACPLCRLLPLR